MIVRITRSGGFAGGSVLVAELDTSRLAPEVQARIEDRIDAVRRFAAGPQPEGFDLFRYEIGIEGGATGRQRLEVILEGDPAALPEPVAALLQEIGGQPPPT